MKGKEGKEHRAEEWKQEVTSETRDEASEDVKLIVQEGGDAHRRETERHLYATASRKVGEKMAKYTMP